MAARLDDTVEWLEADGLGGFASGTASGIRTRRYHALLLTATKPPTGRFVLVNGLDAEVETADGKFALSSQRYQPDVVWPDGAKYQVDFSVEPWPKWRFGLTNGIEIEYEIFARSGSATVVLRWSLVKPKKNVSLRVRPFLSGRDPNALHHENSAFVFEPTITEERTTWRPYNGIPAINFHTNAKYEHSPEWYRNFLYVEERNRGLDNVEDLASPGAFRWNLSGGNAVCILSAGPEADSTSGSESALASYERLRKTELARRKKFAGRLEKAADSYVVSRGQGRTIIAGYPWFADWGRDTFIAMRGLCIATSRMDDALGILREWAATVSQGMLPNRFPEQGDVPEYNSVDASLWYVIAVDDFLQAAARTDYGVARADRDRLYAATEQILDGYSKGTRFGIRLDDDGLLAAGEPGVQLTWMDAKIGDWVVTPRIGKPVEVQALWLNALQIATGISKKWAKVFTKGLASFHERFWNEERQCLYDVIDCEHKRGTADGSLRPNQIFTVGGLPLCLLEDDKARAVVDAVEQNLATPLGLRSLGPQEAAYRGRYEGGVRERDSAYHQGTVWPWLMGPFVEAWLRVRGNTKKAKREAQAKFLEPLMRHLDEAGINHISEIADGDAPHTPRGCPFQAWSVGEALRLQQLLSV